MISLKKRKGGPSQTDVVLENILHELTEYRGELNVCEEEECTEICPQCEAVYRCLDRVMGLIRCYMYK